MRMKCKPSEIPPVETAQGITSYAACHGNI